MKHVDRSAKPHSKGPRHAQRNPRPPELRPDLVIRPLGDQGRHVVKDQRSGAFYEVGEREVFLLAQLNGIRTANSIRAAYEERFAEPLSTNDFDAFIELACLQGLLRRPDADGECPDDVLLGQLDTSPATNGGRTLLHWRKSLWDPDDFFTWLAPHIRFVWTPTCLLSSAVCISFAAVIAWSGRGDLFHDLNSALRWETAILVWLAMLVIGVMHESAHGLTCKHFGGEVHEIGFLLLYLLPGFYCNVSEAWLFQEKSKRLWVTFAGVWFELFLWAAAVLIWRVTVPGTLVHHLAIAVLSVCGIQTLFNILPLLKLDGYYLLSDWLEIPNLHQRAWDVFAARVRQLLWGAPPPERSPRNGLLFRFGLGTWLCSSIVVGSMLWGLSQWLGGWGLGLAFVLSLRLVSIRRLFQDFFAGEFRSMILKRYRRTATWLSLLTGLGVALTGIQIEDWASGPFEARAAVRVELRAPVSGFLKEIHFEEGDRVGTSVVVARLETPDLASRLAQKRAERREAEATYALLESGARSEELAEQAQRVARAKAWHERAERDLVQQQRALAEGLASLDHEIAACRAELSSSLAAVERHRNLLARQAVSRQEYDAAERDYQVCKSRLDQAEAEKRAREAQGTITAEAEVTRRSMEWAEARGALVLLEAGSRPEQLAAACARVDRLAEEEQYLEGLREKQTMLCPVAGLLTTPRLREKTGQFVQQGDLICVVEVPDSVAVEIAIAEQYVERVEAGQTISLKPRALPFGRLAATVIRVAPSTTRIESQSSITVHGRLAQTGPALRPGATGWARIYLGPRPIGEILLQRGLRFLRTEFWW